jgi:hypothetical protein
LRFKKWDLFGAIADALNPQKAEEKRRREEQNRKQQAKRQAAALKAKLLSAGSNELKGIKSAPRVWTPPPAEEALPNQVGWVSRVKRREQ